VLCRISLLVSLFYLLAGLIPAQAQSLAPARTRRVRIEQSCMKDLERFCPELAGTDQLRNQLICLRPYVVDLAIPCRRAVRAASR